MKIPFHNSLALNDSDVHFDDVIMAAMASQITSLTIVYSTVYSGADQRKYQRSASLRLFPFLYAPFVRLYMYRRLDRGPVLRVTGLCAGNPPGTSEFPAQMASNAENVSICWRHHAFKIADETTRYPEVLKVLNNLNQDLVNYNWNRWCDIHSEEWINCFVNHSVDMLDFIRRSYPTFCRWYTHFHWWEQIDIGTSPMETCSQGPHLIMNHKYQAIISAYENSD